MAWIKHGDRALGTGVVMAGVVLMLLLAIGGIEGPTPSCADDCQSGTYPLMYCTSSSCTDFCQQEKDCSTGNCANPYECTCDNSK